MSIISTIVAQTALALVKNILSPWVLMKYKCQEISLVYFFSICQRIAIWLWFLLGSNGFFLRTTNAAILLLSVELSRTWEREDRIKLPKSQKNAQKSRKQICNSFSFDHHLTSTEKLRKNIWKFVKLEKIRIHNFFSIQELLRNLTAIPSRTKQFFSLFFKFSPYRI